MLNLTASVSRTAASTSAVPASGDTGTGLYVRHDIPEFMARRAVPAAEIVTPNQFELRLLTGLPAGTLRAALPFLGVLVYPLLLGLGWVFVRRAERNERDFADLVRGADR